MGTWARCSPHLVCASWSHKSDLGPDTSRSSPVKLSSPLHQEKQPEQCLRTEGCRIRLQRGLPSDTQVLEAGMGLFLKPSNAARTEGHRLHQPGRRRGPLPHTQHPLCRVTGNGQLFKILIFTLQTGAGMGCFLWLASGSTEDGHNRRLQELSRCPFR